MIPSIQSLFFKQNSYAETHYCFKYGFSLLKQKEPEILFDAPWRLEPNKDLPLVLIIKDSNLYPITLQKVTSTISFPINHSTYIKELITEEILLEQELFTDLTMIPLPDNFIGVATINIKVDYIVNGKKRFAWNDNIPFSSHFCLSVNIPESKLPSKNDYTFGDGHYHSYYTNNFVEFGLPIGLSSIMAKQMGLDWFFVTDHSYDLDDRNPNTKLTNAFDKMKSDCLEATKAMAIAGEEISAKNINKRNIHLLVANHQKFIKGYGDSGTQGLDNISEYSPKEIIDKIKTSDNNTFSAAAHPGVDAWFLEKLLMNREEWKKEDFPLYLNAIQFWNGTMDKGFLRGRRKWINLLLEGRRIFAFAGNDAHGDFNLCRKIKIPFISTTETKKHTFGKVRVGVKGDISTPNNLIENLNKGRMFITNGPFLEISFCDTNDNKFYSGDKISNLKGEFTISTISNSEFGNITSISIFTGDLLKKQESKQVINIKEKLFEYNYKLSALQLKSSYIRVEVSSTTKEEVFYAISNPIWINNKE